MTSNNRLKLIPPKLNGGEYRLEIFFNGISFPGAPKLVIVQDLEVRLNLYYSFRKLISLLIFRHLYKIQVEFY